MPIMNIVLKCASLEVSGLQEDMILFDISFYYKECVKYVIPLIGLIVSIVACVYAIKTYRKSHGILDVIQNDRAWRWNKKELEYLFSYLPIDCIDSFFGDPTTIRNELMWGLQRVDLCMFQFEGKEKDLIILFINRLDSFCDLNYKQTPSTHWKFEPLSEYEQYDEEKERTEIKRLESRVSELRPCYDTIKGLLSEYQVNLKEMNKKAHDLYHNSINDE